MQRRFRVARLPSGGTKRIAPTASEAACSGSGQGIVLVDLFLLTTCGARPCTTIRLTPAFCRLLSGHESCKLETVGISNLTAAKTS